MPGAAPLSSATCIGEAERECGMQELIRSGAQIDSESASAVSSPKMFYYDLYGLTFYDKVKGNSSSTGPSNTPPTREYHPRTALRHAAWAGHCHTVETLLNLGADVNSTDSDGWFASYFILTPFSFYSLLSCTQLKAGGNGLLFFQSIFDL